MNKPKKFKVTFTSDLWRKVETTTKLVGNFNTAIKMADEFVKTNSDKYNATNGYHMGGYTAHLDGWNYSINCWQDRFDNLISAKVEPY